MPKQLRPYQSKAVKECWQALKANDQPVLLMASVGAGKSLMIAHILLTMQKHGKRALCLVNNAELVRNNHATLIDEGGKASIYCAALGEKDSSAPIVFGTPQSVLNGIKKNEAISAIQFNLIVVDEAHAINYNNHSSCFIRILRHYKQEYPSMRLLGATGTDFRFKGATIVGPKCLFKSKVGNITTSQLIKDGYLIEPRFEIDDELIIDFSKVRIKNGQFDKKDLAKVIEENERLTKLICAQIVHVMNSQNRFGCFLFATTRKHAQEILSYLPLGKSAIILGDTPQDERTQILDKARRGEIKYLVNISIISVGVDIPPFDTLAYLRPTESLVLLVQTMGRALRLSPKTEKTEALILDFAGNIERHRDWDDPILLEAVAQTLDEDKEYVIECPQCSTTNTETARRCIGYENNARCDYFFEFKDCKQCETQNDIASRYCRNCEAELIDPNAKLSLAINDEVVEVDVFEARYGVTGTESSFTIHAAYQTSINETVYEYYRPTSQKAKNVLYGQFIRKHCDKSSEWYMHLDKKHKMEEMLKVINSPIKLKLKAVDDGFKIKSKVFEDLNHDAIAARTISENHKKQDKPIKFVVSKWDYKSKMLVKASPDKPQ